MCIGVDIPAISRIYHAMARTLIDLPRDMLERLDTERAAINAASDEPVSRAALFRRIVREWLAGRGEQK